MVLAIVSTILLGIPPSSSDSIAEVGEYVAKDNGLHKTGFVFGFVIAIPFVIFLAGFLVPVLKSDREHGEGHGIIVFAGALLLATAAGVGDIAAGALHLRAGDDLGAEATRALQDLSVVGYSAAGIGSAILGLGAALAILKRDVMARWVGWLAVLAAVGGLFGLFGMLSSTGLSDLSIISFITTMVWILGTSVAMIQSNEAAAP